ncbi:hypothetical protein [Lentisalinibacter sediminis]|uniref:hypothetical protein n=1 Tax=Lentisalinibacter sediminis TaxID=2992237 RepID=UPI00386528CC
MDDLNKTEMLARDVFFNCLQSAVRNDLSAGEVAEGLRDVLELLGDITTEESHVECRMVDSNTLVRLPCSVCGCLNERAYTKVEMANGPMEGGAVCFRCLEDRERITPILESITGFTWALPSVEEFHAEERRRNDEAERLHNEHEQAMRERPDAFEPDPADGLPF